MLPEKSFFNHDWVPKISSSYEIIKGVEEKLWRKILWDIENFKNKFFEVTENIIPDFSQVWLSLKKEGIESSLVSKNNKEKNNEEKINKNILYLELDWINILNNYLDENSNDLEKTENIAEIIFDINNSNHEEAFNKFNNIFWKNKNENLKYVKMNKASKINFFVNKIKNLQRKS